MIRHEEKIIKIADLVHDSDNPRNHDSIANRRSVRSSLEAHGQVVPILVQRGTNKVIHGNLRVETMREMGQTDAVCWVVDADSIEAKRLAITLNKTGELGGWNEDVLARQLQDLTDTLPDFDLEDIGFNASILDAPEDPFGGAEEVVNEEYFSDDSEDDVFGDEFEDAWEDPEDDIPGAPSAPSKPDSTVVQVFIQPEEQETFTNAIQRLADHWGLNSTSDVIIESIKRSAADVLH